MTRLAANLCSECGAILPAHHFSCHQIVGTKDEIRVYLQAENAKLRAEVDGWKAMAGVRLDEMLLAQQERDATFLQVREMMDALSQAAVAMETVECHGQHEDCTRCERIRWLRAKSKKPEHDALRLGESRNLTYPRPISDDDATKQDPAREAWNARTDDPKDTQKQKCLKCGSESLTEGGTCRACALDREV